MKKTQTLAMTGLPLLLQDTVKELLSQRLDINVVQLCASANEEWALADGQAGAFDMLLTVTDSEQDAYQTAQHWLQKQPHCAVICVNHTATRGMLFQLKIESTKLDEFTAESLHQIIRSRH